MKRFQRTVSLLLALVLLLGLVGVGPIRVSAVQDEYDVSPTAYQVRRMWTTHTTYNKGDYTYVNDTYIGYAKVLYTRFYDAETPADEVERAVISFDARTARAGETVYAAAIALSNSQALKVESNVTANTTSLRYVNDKTTSTSYKLMTDTSGKYVSAVKNSVVAYGKATASETATTESTITNYSYPVTVELDVTDAVKAAKASGNNVQFAIFMPKDVLINAGEAGTVNLGDLENFGAYENGTVYDDEGQVLYENIATASLDTSKTVCGTAAYYDPGPSLEKAAADEYFYWSYIVPSTMTLTIKQTSKEPAFAAYKQSLTDAAGMKESFASVSGLFDETLWTLFETVSTAEGIYEALYEELGKAADLAAFTDAFGKTVRQYIVAGAAEGVSEERFADMEADLKWLGRVYKENEFTYFNWTNAGFEFKIHGTGAKAVIASNNPGGTNTAYLKIYVDGEALKSVALESDVSVVTLVEGLEDAEHTIKVIKRTNGRSSTAALGALWVDEGTEILEPNGPSERKMQLVGDSITVGFGSMATSGSWSTATEDGSITYAALAAEYFGADSHTVAVSGRGIYANYDNTDPQNRAPYMYEFTDWNNKEDWDHTKFQPDVIVVNYGTNDKSTGVSASNFKTAAKAFVKQIRAKNPDAHIIYAYGFMGTDYATQVSELVQELNTAGDAKIYYLPLTAAASSEKGIASHPTAAAHESRAKALITKITEITGWTEYGAADEAVTAVIEQIAAIGTVTADKKEAILQARAAYEALTDSQKKQVVNYGTLAAAELALEYLDYYHVSPVAYQIRRMWCNADYTKGDYTYGNSTYLGWARVLYTRFYDAATSAEEIDRAVITFDARTTSPGETIHVAALALSNSQGLMVESNVTANAASLRYASDKTTATNYKLMTDTSGKYLAAVKNGVVAYGKATSSETATTENTLSNFTYPVTVELDVTDAVRAARRNGSNVQFVIFTPKDVLIDAGEAGTVNLGDLENFGEYKNGTVYDSNGQVLYENVPTASLDTSKTVCGTGGYYVSGTTTAANDEYFHWGYVVPSSMKLSVKQRSLESAFVEYKQSLTGPEDMEESFATISYLFDQSLWARFEEVCNAEGIYEDLYAAICEADDVDAFAVPFAQIVNKYYWGGYALRLAAETDLGGRRGKLTVEGTGIPELAYAKAAVLDAQGNVLKTEFLTVKEGKGYYNYYNVAGAASIQLTLFSDGNGGTQLSATGTVKLNQLNLPEVFITEITNQHTITYQADGSAQNSGSSEQKFQYVELYNYTDAPVDLADYTFVYHDNVGSHEFEWIKEDGGSLILEPGEPYIIGVYSADSAKLGYTYDTNDAMAAYWAGFNTFYNCSIPLTNRVMIACVASGAADTMLDGINHLERSTDAGVTVSAELKKGEQTVTKVILAESNPNNSYAFHFIPSDNSGTEEALLFVAGCFPGKLMDEQNLGYCEKTFLNGTEMLRVMSYNILATEKSASDNHTGLELEEREDLFMEVLADYQVDIVGMQEVNDRWAPLLQADMPAAGYAEVQGISRDGQDYSSISGTWDLMNPIYYKADKFSLLESGAAMLTPDGKVGTKQWDSVNMKRSMTWAVLEDKESGEIVNFINTHLVLSGKQARVEQVKLLYNKGAELKAKYGGGIVITGDHNMHEGSEPYQYYINSNVVTDSRYLTTNHTVMRSTGYQVDGITEKYGIPIDYVMVSPDNYFVEKYEIYTGEYPQGHLSDHYAVYVELYNKEHEDTDTPVITGVEENGTYYQSANFAVVDQYIKSVSVNGEQIEYTSGDYRVSEIGDYTVTAMDMAGRTVSVSFTVTSQVTVEIVTEMIDAIGDVTLESESRVVDARAAYDALTEEQQTQIGNYGVLTDAEAELERLKSEQGSEDQEAADAVIEKIGAIGAVSLDSEEAIAQAREAYDALTEEQQALVTNVQTLIAAEQTLKELKSKLNLFDKDSEDNWLKSLTNKGNKLTNETKYANIFTTHPIPVAAGDTLCWGSFGKEDYVLEVYGQDGNYLGQVLSKNIASYDLGTTVTGVGDVSVNQHLFACTITNTGAAYVRILGNISTMDSFQVYKNVENGWAGVLVNKIDAIGEVTLDSEPAIAEAREIYDALPDSQKALVTNYAVLTAAEKALEDLKAQLEGVYADVVNLFDKSHSDNWFRTISNNGKALFDETKYANIFTTHPIAVKAGDKLSWGSFGQEGYVMEIFDEDHGFIRQVAFEDVTSYSLGTTVAGISGNKTQYRFEYTVTDGDAAYVRMLGNTSTIGSFQVFKNLEPEWPKMVIPAENTLRGKSVLFVGDSITNAVKDSYGKSGWAGRIGDLNDMNWTNAGVSGASASTCRQNNRVLQQMVDNKDKDYDYVILHAGVNDAMDSAQIGTVTESFNVADFDVATFAGGLEEMFYYANEYFPDAIHGYIVNYATPNSTWGGATKNMKPYFDVAKAVCIKWGVPYIDLYEGTVTVRGQELSYSEDILQMNTAISLYNKSAGEVHIGGRGYDVISGHIADWMKTLNADDIADAKAAGPVIVKINGIGTVKLDSKSAIDEAREAYDALTDDQQALVSNYELLIAAEEAYAKLENQQDEEIVKAIEAARAAAEAAQAKAEEAQAAAEAAKAEAEAAKAAVEEAQAAAEAAKAEAEAAQANAEEAAAAAAQDKTAAEAAKAAAEAAQAKAEEAQTKAEAAQTAAETAETNAKTAETNAETAQTKAEEAQAKAEAAQAAAEQSNTEAAAEAAKAAEEAAKAAAEAAKAAVESGKAAEEAGNAAASASAAATSASQSAASAADAAQAAKDAQDAQAKAEAAQAAAEAAQKAAEEEKKLAEEAAKKAEEEKAAAEAAKAAAEAEKAAAAAAKKAAEEARAKAEAAQKATEEAALKAAKYQAVMSIDGYVLSIDQSGYGKDQIEALAKAVSDAKAAIEAAKNADEIQAAVEDGKAAIEEIKTTDEDAIEDKCPSEAFTDVAADGWYHDAVDYMIEKGYMNGMSDTQFGVDGSVTRGQLVTILYRIAGEPAVKAENPFTDVEKGQWYTDAVIWAAGEGVVNGITATTFAPAQAITREQLVTMLWRYAGEPEGDEEALAGYTDAAAVGAYAQEAMAWAVENGIVSGVTETTLVPGATATRAQIAIILMRYFTER